MCLGIHYIHAECNHAKKFDVVEACDFVNGTACNNLTTIHTIVIKAPSLCVCCFRQKEATIDAEYKTVKRDLRTEIARADECLAKGGPLTERASTGLQGYSAECKDNILQARASRDLSIRLFRQEQGVWGDG